MKLQPVFSHAMCAQNRHLRTQ